MDERTKELVEAAEARAAKATAGPWVKLGVREVGYHARHPDGDMRPCGLVDVDSVWRGEQDRDFIANARVDVPALCSALRDQGLISDARLKAINRLEGRVSELESENATWRKDVEDAAGELLISIPQPGTEAAKMLLANRAMQRERDASDESNATLSRKLGGLSEMLAAYGLPSEPKALAGAIERERAANRDRIEYMESWLEEFVPIELIHSTIQKSLASSQSTNKSDEITI
jgi:hypothetical protein